MVRGCIIYVMRVTKQAGVLLLILGSDLLLNWMDGWTGDGCMYETWVIWT